MPRDYLTIKIPAVWPLSAWLRARQRWKNRQLVALMEEWSADPPLLPEEREEYRKLELELAHDGGRHDYEPNAECPRCREAPDA